MIFLANVLYGLKKSFWFMTVLTGIVLLEEFFVLVFYNMAVSAHIPLVNFDLFMENIYYMVTIFSLFSGFFFLFMVHVWKVKKVSLLIFANGIVALLAAYSGGMHVAKFETLFFLTFKGVIVSFVGAALCSIIFRVMMNQFFRELFVQHFQEKCERSLFTENWLRAFNPLRKIIHFFDKHFQNPEKNWIAQSNWSAIREELTGDCSAESPYVKEPKDIIDQYFSVKVKFKFIPQTFVFLERTWEIKEAEQAVLFNQEEEK